MSHISFEPGKMKLDFSKGFAWISLMKIIEQKHDGRKIIFEIEQNDSPFRLTIGLDEDNNLNVWLRDIQNNEFSLEPISNECFFNKWASVICELFFNKDTKLSELALNIVVEKQNYSTKKEIQANIGSNTHLNLVIGSNLEHEENAAFTMSNLKIYNTILTESEKNQLLIDFT